MEAAVDTIMEVMGVEATSEIMEDTNMEVWLYDLIFFLFPIIINCSWFAFRTRKHLHFYRTLK